MRITPGSLKLFPFIITLMFSLASSAPGKSAAPSGPPLRVEKLAPTALDADVFELRAFAEPLVPTAPTGTAEEDAALRVAVNGFLAGGTLEPLDAFLTAWPNSRWAAGLEYNLGLRRFAAGYFTRAETHWQRAWDLTRGSNLPEVRALANQALAQMARMQSRLGRKEALKPLLSGANGREIGGSARQMIDTAQSALAASESRPGQKSTSSLSALGDVRAALNLPQAFAPEITAVPSTPQGISLAEISSLATSLNLPNQVVRRTKGDDIPVPSIAHLKLGHYAAIVGKSEKGFQVRDAVFGFDNVISADAILTEGSGYFVIPTTKMPKGFEPVPENEASGISGSGDAEIPKDGSYRASDIVAVQSPAPQGTGGPNTQGLATYAVHAMLVSLHVAASPLDNTMAFGPDTALQIAYNERDTTQPANLNVTNFGRQWTLNWNATLVVESPNTARILLRGGGFEDYPIGLAGRSSEHADSQARLVRQSSTQWARKLPDGSREIYSALVPPGANGTGTYYLTQLSDTFGNTVKLEYDASYRLSGLRDALGRVTTFSYGLNGKQEKYRVTKVTDAVGRSASFTYNAAGQLETVTNAEGRESKFTYAAGDVLNGLENPYGKTTFARELKGDTRWIEATDPLGGQQRVEYDGENPSVPGSDEKPPANPVTVGDKKVAFLVDNTALDLRNTFVWDKLQMAERPRDYAASTVYHWLQGREDAGVTSPVPSSIKLPLESRAWFNYPEQASATQEGTSKMSSKVARVLDDGTTQLAQYSDKPKPPVPPKPKEIVILLPLFTDPLNRETWVTFTISVPDQSMKSIRMGQRIGKAVFDILWTRTFDAANRKVTDVDAAGQETSYTYNERGLILTKIDPLKQKTSYAYDANGRLITVDPPLAGPLDRITYTYDDRSRRTSISQWGYTIKYSYPSAYLTRATYPDGTYEETDDSKPFAIEYRDRQGNLTEQTYDANFRLSQVTDSLQRVTHFAFSKGGDLLEFTDPLGHATKFEYNAADRLVSKTYADGAKFTYAYLNNGLLQSATDAAGQATKYTYAKDNRLTKIDYSGGKVPTPSVAWTWDVQYPRVTQMRDGLGLTKYTYVKPNALGAGLIASVDGPVDGDTDLTAYTYDALNRVARRSIHGSENFIERTFDPLDRVTKERTNVGIFNYAYNDHGLLQSISFPHGQVADYAYYDAAGDFRLKTLSQHIAGNDLLTENYTYSPEGSLLTRQQQGSGVAPETFTYCYDAGYQLTRAAAQRDTTHYPITYSYDAAANMLTTASPGSSLAFTYNAINARAGTVGGAQEFDRNGSLTKSPNFAVTWDAANHPTSITFGQGRKVEYDYDGYGRRVGIRGFLNGVKQDEYRYVWDGLGLCEERNLGASKIAHSFYYPQGELKYVAGDYMNLFYVKDRQGSIRKATIAPGSTAVENDYPPFGTTPDLPFKEPAPTDVDFGYTGDFICPVTGLNLTPYRILGYAAWFSRDPIFGGSTPFNPYAYALNNPLTYTDVLGLTPVPAKPLGGESAPLAPSGEASSLTALNGPRDFWLAPWCHIEQTNHEPTAHRGEGNPLGTPESRALLERAARFSPTLPSLPIPQNGSQPNSSPSNTFQPYMN